jgi:hypothetical protein
LSPWQHCCWQINLHSWSLEFLVHSHYTHCALKLFSASQILHSYVQTYLIDEDIYQAQNHNSRDQQSWTRIRRVGQRVWAVTKSILIWNILTSWHQQLLLSIQGR